jgi:hypothetical protein
MPGSFIYTVTFDNDRCFTADVKGPNNMGVSAGDQAMPTEVTGCAK